MYNPYRTNSCLKNKKELTYKRNFFIKIIRRWFLSLLIFFAGTYKKRYPIKCPCGDRYKTKRYYVNNKLHRKDGPAVEFADGSKEWWKNGKLHRKDGPAIEYANGDKSWYQNGELHREDGPAMEYVNGNKFWYKNGMNHREDGPALEYSSGVKCWYLNNTYYGSNSHFTNDSWKNFIKTLIFS